MKIRKATESDAARFIEIKNQLSIKNVDGTASNGGFLLGTDLDTYQEYVKNEIVLVADYQNSIVGFGIILKNSTVRKTDIWQKRTQVDWTEDVGEYDSLDISYFEQLAFSPGYSRLVFRLCYVILNTAFLTHDVLFTTTVRYPILNLAAVPYILKAGGRKIGSIKEHYPAVGHIISDIYRINKIDFENHIVHKDDFSFLNKKEIIR